MRIGERTTNVVWDRIPNLASHVGELCVGLRVFPVFLLKKPTSLNFNSICDQRAKDWSLTRLIFS